MKWIIALLFAVMLVRLAWYEVMVRALTAWIRHTGRVPSDAQIDFLVKQEMKRFLLGK